MKRTWLFLLIILLVSLGGTQISAEDYVPRFVFVGDSNTASKQWENGSYVVKLHEFGSPWTGMDLINSGKDGWGSYSYFQNPTRISEYILDYQPDFILIALGGNDFLKFYSTDEFELYYGYLLSTLFNISNSCGITQIYLANIYWGNINLPEKTVERYVEFQHVIDQFGVEYQIPVIDFFSTTENHTEYYLKDNIHLNEEGHWAIANTTHNSISSDISDHLGSLFEGEKACELPSNSEIRSLESVSKSETPLLASYLTIMSVGVIAKKTRRGRFCHF